MVDIALRLASVVIAVVLAYQMFFTKRGGLWHRRVGALAMLCGIVLVVLVAIRGAQQETFSGLYITHLLIGGIFFLCLFYAGISGWKLHRSKGTEDTSLSAPVGHVITAYATMYLLVATLIFGVLSRLFH
ncbi:MAG: hypothetical protein M3M85_00680 [bacterium]|nr:hypothetical protein [bacterium]